MQRKHFLLLAGFLALFFGLGMVVAPEKMLGSMSTLTDAGSPHVMRWLGSGLLAIGTINVYARNDAGSEALRAIMIGNIVLHIVALTTDLADFSAGIVTTPGAIMGTVVHVGLASGFLFYLRRMNRPGTAAV